MNPSIRFFVSYAHDDGKLPGKLLRELKKQLGACKDYKFCLWQDTEILLGEKWHGEIQSAIGECDFGLLLVSPAFLSSHYIDQYELGRFASGEKFCLPVALHRIDFKTQNLKGLEAYQFFCYHSEGADAPLEFAHYHRSFAADFAHELYRKIHARIIKLPHATSAATSPQTSSAKRKAPRRTTTSNNLPRLRHFFGRVKELEKIADALDPMARTWGALIDGPGGIGKTSLAIRAAELTAPGQFHRILFISAKEREMTAEGETKLTGFVLPGYLEMLNEIARLLGKSKLTQSKEGERDQLIRDALAPEKALLIFDSLESFTPVHRKMLYTFLSRLPPGCKAIATSRTHHEIDALSIPLGRLDREAALAYLGELATERPLLELATVSERETLYHETQGNPLLLRWLAGQLGRGGCRTVSAAIDFLRRAPADNDPLEFIFHDLLATCSQEEKQALSALAHFTRPVEVKHIAEIANLTRPVAKIAIDELCKRALVLEGAERAHFVVIPPAADLLRRPGPGVAPDTAERLAERAYVRIVENGFRKNERFDALEAQWSTIAPAMRVILAGPSKRLQRMCSALTHFLDYTGRWDEWLTLCLQAEPIAVADDDPKEAGWRAYQAGYVHYKRGQLNELRGCAARTIQHWSDPRIETRERAAGIRLRGLVQILAGEWASAIATLSEALRLDRSLFTKSRDVAIDLADLAEAERGAGDLDAAQRHHRASLRVNKVVANAEGIANEAGKLAELALRRQAWRDAEGKARDALSLAEKLGRKDLIASAKRVLAHALAKQGRRPDAIRYASEAVELHSGLGMLDLESARETLRECAEGPEG